jgi:predicted dehydrogenase
MVCTATGISAHAVGTKHGFATITTDPEAVFKSGKVNTVFITTRHNTHAEYVIKALKAGKHVFVEKPLCLNETELREIEETYFEAAAGQQLPILALGYNRRFSPLIQKMKDSVGDNPMAIVYRVNAGMIPRDVWIQDGEIGGGRIVGEVCHFVDACSFLAGSEPILVYAGCVRKDDRSIPDEDNVSINLSFANGSTATINYFAYGDRQVPKEYVELFCGNVAMQMNDFRELVICKGGKRNRVKNSNQDKGFVGELEAFKKALAAGNPPISFASLCNTSRVTFAVLQSLRTGLPVSVGSSCCDRDNAG